MCVDDKTRLAVLAGLERFQKIGISSKVFFVLTLCNFDSNMTIVYLRLFGLGLVLGVVSTQKVETPAEKPLQRYGQGLVTWLDSRPLDTK